MDIEEIIRNRRTIHDFNREKVSEDKIHRAIQAANYAPCHRLSFPWRFISVTHLKRELIGDLYIEIKSKDSMTEEIKQKIKNKILNPSHLIIASQILAPNPIQKKEDYAACCCAIQNLTLCLAGDGIGSKWSTSNLITNKETYRILGLNPLEEEIIGFIYIGYGKTPPPINRPSIKSIYKYI